MAEQKMVINQAGEVTTVYKRRTSQIECPQCQQMVDLLYGTDENEGKQGCEDCYKPPKTPEEVKVGDVNPDQVEEFNQSVTETVEGSPTSAQPATPAPRVVSHEEKTQQLLSRLGVKK